MGQKKTPLIQKLRNEGGTLYVFPSAQEDIALNLSSTTSGVAMSHYALLNIPTIDKSKYLCDYDATTDDPNLAISMSLQNYMMNFETLLTNREDYNYQDLSTISEQAFWHWALKVGIINEADFTKVNDSSIYTETDKLNKVIKCFGAIDAGNTLSTEFGMFNETYINIPTSYGAGPVYFEVTDTDNYHINREYQYYTPAYLEGRTDKNAYYSYTNGQDYPFLDNNDTKYSYETKAFDGLKLVKEIPHIQKYINDEYSEGKNNLIITSYDDINIDVNNDFNLASKFDFNAILLYYSVYDQDDMVKTPYATNLFGIIFLDGVRTLSDNEDQLYIAPLEKRKSSTTAFGNSYSFRVNLKTMSVYDNTDAVIQDNTTMSSIAAVDFSDALSNLNQAVDILNSNNQLVQQIQNKYAAILQFYDELQSKIDDLSTCLSAYLKGTKSSFIDTSVLYTNEIRTTKINPNEDIKVYVGQTSTEPVITISDSVDIPLLNSQDITASNNYVHIDNIKTTDFNVVTNEDTDIYVNNTKEVLNRLLDPAYLSVMVNNKDELDQELKLYQMYISPESQIFNEGSDMSLSFLKSENGDIDYAKLVPYLIALLQLKNK